MRDEDYVSLLHTISSRHEPDGYCMTIEIVTFQTVVLGDSHEYGQFSWPSDGGIPLLVHPFLLGPDVSDWLAEMIAREGIQVDPAQIREAMARDGAEIGLEG